MDVPYLIQRVNRRERVSESSKGVDQHFTFDYMGSSEFEFGTIPKTMKDFRRIARKAWKVREIVFSPDMRAFFIGREEDTKVAKAILVDQVIGTQALRFKELTYLYDSYTGKNRHWDGPSSSTFDGWWAITENPFIFFKEKENAKLWLKCLLEKK